MLLYNVPNYKNQGIWKLYTE